MALTALKQIRERDLAEDPIVLSSMDRALERRLLTPSRVAAAFSVVAMLALVGYAYVEYGLTRTLSVDPQRLSFSTVAFGTFREYIPVTGSIVPRTTVFLDAIEGGQVTAVHVEAGAIVEAGDPLVRLKNTNLQLEAIGREAQLTEQLNDLSGTRLSFEQNRLRHRLELIDLDYEIERLERHIAQREPLVGTGGAARGELDDLQSELAYRRALRTAVLEAQSVDVEFQATQIERLQEAVDAMNLNLGIARENLENLVITAPIAGQLTLLEANVGESKAPGQRVGQIDELGAFKVSAFIDEFYLPRVSLGQVATLELGAAEHELEVAKIYPDVRNRQFEVELSFLDAAPALLRRGQTVRMRLDIGEPADTLVVENGAYYDDTGGRWVFVVDAAGEAAVRRSVRFGRRNPEGVEVLEGIGNGDRIVTSSYENLVDFDRIEFQESVR
jgi:HlyD family secretion protein